MEFAIRLFFASLWIGALKSIPIMLLVISGYILGWTASHKGFSFWHGCTFVAATAGLLIAVHAFVAVKGVGK